MADLASMICASRRRIPGGLGPWMVMGVHEHGAGTGVQGQGCGIDDVHGWLWVVVKDADEFTV